jgi:uncharacterized membrane protein YcaP (DUF421 family)
MLKTLETITRLFWGSRTRRRRYSVPVTTSNLEYPIKMLQQLWERFIWMIGGDQAFERLPVWQVALRTVIIYVVALAIIRLAKRRFMGSYSAFDILLGFIVGSVMARSITGSLHLIDMIVVIGVLAIIHWAIATVVFYWGGFGKVVDNAARKLIVDGEINADALAKSKISEDDLMQALREKGSVDDAADVKAAYLESDGIITVIPKQREPQVIEVDVKEGVQTVRIILNGS